MPEYQFEFHTMNDPLLPFRFRPFMNVTQRQSLPNWHEETEILYCFEGRGQVRLGEESVPFVCGDTVLVNTQTPHFVQSDETVLYCCLIVKSGFLKENGLDPTLLHFEHRIRTGEMQSRMEEVRRAFADFAPQKTGAVLRLRTAVLSVFCLLCQSHSAPSSEHGKSSELAKAALTYLHTHFREQITLDGLAAFVGTSKFHLSREFKRSTGRTVMSTVGLLRLYEAKERIEKGERVSDAARASGFSNLSYFTRAFRRQFQTLPSQLQSKKDA